ncbi:hypothetical protein [Enterobacter asburiae]|uniref:hypothetical protein n=1 Tax=Enterobacter asburiae TaxID=61645 RepID=UPI0021CB8657|nr:hypothetical protein [Enterobacter asburiae]
MIRQEHPGAGSRSRRNPDAPRDGFVDFAGLWPDFQSGLQPAAQLLGQDIGIVLQEARAASPGGAY